MTLESAATQVIKLTIIFSIVFIPVIFLESVKIFLDWWDKTEWR